jgi:threonine/homoserine/homoserine lactone efflux protein
VSGAGPIAAFAFGFALGAAPGPVQLLILSQTARRGFGGGVRVMLGANLTLLAILIAIAVGVSAAEPSETALRALRVIGGLVLIAIAGNELRTLLGARPADDGSRSEGTASERALSPTVVGIVAVLLNPGAWIFFATTAASILATTSTERGTTAAIVTAVFIAAGVSASDLSLTLLGSGGRRLIGDRGLRIVRTVLAAGLLVVGVAFVWQGVWPSPP